MWLCKQLFLLAISLIVISQLFTTLINGQELTVQTLQGKVKGYMANSNTKAFLGIRYAETTGGSNRFRPPVELADTLSSTVSNATSYGNICIQQSSENVYSQPLSEDCLFLNIWTPIDASATNQYPVMFWIHGGNFIYGSGNIYASDYWVKLSQDNNVPVVVVTINYRLGVFGFMTDALFGAENGRTNTNFGLLDQLTALKWVRKNIANFGGNPNKITISGESAGAVSSVIMLTSPLLYNTSSSYYTDIKGAIVQSGTSLKWNMQIQQSTAQGFGSNLKSFFGCNTDSSNTLSCLRGLSADALNIYQQYNTSDKFSPVVDNYVVLRDIFDSYDKGLYKKVNLLIGVTRNEMNGFTCGVLSNTITDTQMKGVFTGYFGLSKMQQFYPQLSNYYTLANYGNNLAYLNDILSNSNVQCNTRYLAATVSQSVYNTYMYTYDHYYPYTPACQKSAHAIELPLQFPALFGIRGAVKVYTMSSEEAELSRQLIVYWSNFVSSGSPNKNAKNVVNLNNQTYWDRYTTCNDTQIILQTGGNVLNNTMYSKVCPFWNPFDEVPTIACNATNPGPSPPTPESSTTPTPQASSSTPTKNTTNPTTSGRTVNGTVSNKVNEGISSHSFSASLIVACVLFLLLSFIQMN